MPRQRPFFAVLRVRRKNPYNLSKEVLKRLRWLYMASQTYSTSNKLYSSQIPHYTLLKTQQFHQFLNEHNF